MKSEMKNKKQKTKRLSSLIQTPTSIVRTEIRHTENVCLLDNGCKISCTKQNVPNYCWNPKDRCRLGNECLLFKKRWSKQFESTLNEILNTNVRLLLEL
jgi:hypothetical protein